jgi:hypothetical protein
MRYENIEKKIDGRWSYKDTGKEVADEVNNLGWRLFYTNYFACAGYKKGDANKDARRQAYYISGFLLRFENIT